MQEESERQYGAGELKGAASKQKEQANGHAAVNRFNVRRRWKRVVFDRPQERNQHLGSLEEFSQRKKNLAGSDRQGHSTSIGPGPRKNWALLLGPSLPS